MYSPKLTQDPHNDRHTQQLPTELLIAIVDHVDDDEDLLTLAVTSRRFHALSLNHYFRRYDFDPYSKEIEIDIAYGSHKILGGLSIFLDLVGASVERLSYDCGYCQDEVRMAKEVHLLTNYISKLSSVKRATLRLAMYGAGAASERRNVNIILLNTILGKCCSDVRVITSQLSSVNEEVKNMPAYSKPADWLKDYWPPRHDPPRNQELKSCYIQTFPRLLRPFYFHTLGTNSASITDLAFKNIFGGGADWATMLAHLHFPRLRRFTVIYGVIQRDPFIKFLAKHPGTLTTFEYHHIRYEPRPKHPARSTALEPVFRAALDTLTTSPEHITNFLPSLACMARLAAVTISIEELVSSFSALEGALRHLAACARRITLTLAIVRTGLGLGAWFATILAARGGFADAARPERRLRCVETLVVDNGDWGFADGTMDVCLPRWVALFPELRALTLRGGRQAYKHLALVDVDDSGGPPDLVALVKEACPGLYVEYTPRDLADS
ncbi:hypothetical protein BJ912DRAFT_388996 [Pholiota molesta]|nr:hypothetical protein BJ912DRAFT_388996 [Pholiota molesta]